VFCTRPRPFFHAYGNSSADRHHHRPRRRSGEGESAAGRRRPGIGTWCQRLEAYGPYALHRKGRQTLNASGNFSDDSARMRDLLASNRIMLAWLRTAVSFAGLGFVVARFGLDSRFTVPVRAARDLHDPHRAADDAPGPRPAPFGGAAREPAARRAPADPVASVHGGGMLRARLRPARRLPSPDRDLTDARLTYEVALPQTFSSPVQGPFRA
jgi:hypothetical protein